MLLAMVLPRVYHRMTAVVTSKYVALVLEDRRNGRKCKRPKAISSRIDRDPSYLGEGRCSTACGNVAIVTLADLLGDASTEQAKEVGTAGRLTLNRTYDLIVHKCGGSLPYRD